MSRATVRAIALGLALAAAGAARAGPLPAPPFLSYVETWSEVATARPDETLLARVPGYVNMVSLAFARPDAAYAGGRRLKGTGLQVPFAGEVLREAAMLLRRRHPGTRVLLSVGGSAYTGWTRFDPGAIARLVADLGLDGVDLDIEPAAPPACASDHGGGRRCASDALLSDAILAMRRAMPRPALLLFTGWSVGAFGEGRWAGRDGLHAGPYAGMALAPLAEAGRALDGVVVMAYDAPPPFEPWEAFEAYRAAWPGTVLLGVQGPPTSTGWPRYDPASVQALARRVRAAGGGMMLYTLQKRPAADLLAPAVCRGLGTGGCDAPLPRAAGG